MSLDDEPTSLDISPVLLPWDGITRLKLTSIMDLFSALSVIINECPYSLENNLHVLESLESN
jgi:hypothetical protein